MRQTLWAEQVIKHNCKSNNGPTEIFLNADNYLHIHVIPKENDELLKKQYACSGFDMETTWRKNLKDNTKYRIISPEDFLQNIDRKEYADLIDYLKNRYWD